MISRGQMQKQTSKGPKMGTRKMKGPKHMQDLAQKLTAKKLGQAAEENPVIGMKKGGKVKGRDGCAKRGKTKGTIR